MGPKTVNNKHSNRLENTASEDPLPASKRYCCPQEGTPTHKMEGFKKIREKYFFENKKNSTKSESGEAGRWRERYLALSYFPKARSAAPVMGCTIEAPSDP